MERLQSVAGHLKQESVLIANRGEIAVRISRGIAAEGLRSIAIYGKDDSRSLHVAKCDDSVELSNSGTSAYLDPEDIVKAAKKANATYVAPGYGFLSESAPFAQLCEDNGLIFVGPTPDQLAVFGDKSSARKVADEAQVPTLEGTKGPTTLEDAKKFMQSLPSGSAVMIKALSGGGGRGMREVHDIKDLESSYQACRSEAAASFGPSLDGVYVERLVRHPRHLEIQVIGDGTGKVQHLWERDCTLQRRHQKLVEIAPAPNLNPAVRDKAIESALRIASAVKLRSLATVEFLVDTENQKNATSGSIVGDANQVFFMEVNPRIQVEHTVTEMVTNFDLVRCQLLIAQGATLAQLGLSNPPPVPKKTSIQLRINAETLNQDGSVVPSIGRVSRFEPPAGHGLRLDSASYSGYMVSPHYDSLLAKLIITTDKFSDSIILAQRALQEFFIGGIDTNIKLLLGLLLHKDVYTYAPALSTHFVEKVFLPTFTGAQLPPTKFLQLQDDNDSQAKRGQELDPSLVGIENLEAFTTAIGGTVKSLKVKDGDRVSRGQLLIVLEAMKMEHEIKSDKNGIIHKPTVQDEDIVQPNDTLFWIEESNEDGGAVASNEAEIDPDYIRPDLQKVLERRAFASPEARKAAVEKRHSRGFRHVWENVYDLFEKDTFVEYGGGAVAAQRRRRTLDDLLRNTVADGVVTGVGTVRDKDSDTKQRVALIAYDYTVLAGTQGLFGHIKHDRILKMAEMLSLPLVLYGEGGGGRPGDVDGKDIHGSGLSTSTFGLLAKLSGQVPLVAIVAGNCFAGNAALVGVCDVLIATENSTMGMAGPKMIEGGGLGLFKSEDIGPPSMHVPNGVIDVLVKDEAEATEVARQYLSFFIEPLRKNNWKAPDQRYLRHSVPENRKLVYDMRSIVSTIADEGSLLELRPKFGHSLFTFFCRIEGRAVGILASNPNHLGGAIDSDSADKGSRFFVLCDAFDIPIITLVDTPGFMVGPHSEKTAQVRHFGRLFVSSATCTVPFISVIIRKAVGLGAQGLLQGDVRSPVYTAAWPTASLVPMGIEGSVRLGFSKELEEVPEGPERNRKYEELVAHTLEKSSALNSATIADVDEVLDPAETRIKFAEILKGIAIPERPFTRKKKRTMVDTW